MKSHNIFPLLVALLCIFQKRSSTHSLNAPGSPGYYQDGDFIIGGLFSLRHEVYIPPFAYAHLTKHYQQVLAMVFAVNEINKKLNLLFNMSLGFYIFNVDYIEMKAVESSLSLLSCESPPVPNYNCRPEKRDKLVAVIGGISTGISTQISRVVSLYSVPQISYGPFDHSLKDSVQLQSIYQFPMNTAALYQGLIQLMLHFGWVWVGFVVPDDIRGDKFLQDMTQEMNNNGLCIAFAERIPEFPADDTINMQHFFERYTTTRVSVAFGDTYSLLRYVYHIYCSSLFGNILVTTLDWDITTIPFQQGPSYTYFGGGLSFSFHIEEIPGFKTFLRSVQPTKYPHDVFIQHVWSILFECLYMNQNGIMTFTDCKENGTLETRYNVYAAVNVIAWALHDLLSIRTEEEPPDNVTYVNSHPWQTLLNCFIKLHFYIFGYLFYLPKFHLCLHVYFQLFSVKIYSPLSQKYFVCWISFDLPLVQAPSAICNPSCQIGFRKTAVKGKSSCCFDCIPCPGGEVANKTDMHQCVKCPENQYPNMERYQCLPKVMTFLSYDDTLGTALASTAICLSVLTALILGLFIQYRNAPIVRANNRNLSYVLLISLILCFFCSLMFIGRPSPVTCILRQTFFGVVFSIAVSAILTKTFIVLVAFKSIKPGSSIQMWMVTRISNAIVYICSLIQGCICTVWLATSPPFPDTDTQSEFGQIILHCNEGSTVAFYCVLGYLGFLAFLSLVLAFLGRRLPDKFNEAKMITFSMLVFCSVWISFIPSYLSTKGKTIVALEIFAILSSSAGLLGCIFLPKCYLILVRPENNSRKKLHEPFT
uniref:G-protein coupled receptors family 3 profile domain-containing protein n=1 Tax=Cavia porcellus TaxID=10141 RepID=H0WBT9_CAVPO